MRFTRLLPLAAVAAAFVIPDEEVLADVAVQQKEPITKSTLDRLPCLHNLFGGLKSWTEKAKNAVIDRVRGTKDQQKISGRELVEPFFTP